MENQFERGMSAETNRYIEAMLSLAYDPGGVHDLPAPNELEALEAEARERDPQFWNTLDRVYGGITDG